MQAQPRTNGRTDPYPARRLPADGALHGAAHARLPLAPVALVLCRPLCAVPLAAGAKNETRDA